MICIYYLYELTVCNWWLRYDFWCWLLGFIIFFPAEEAPHIIQSAQHNTQSRSPAVPQPALLKANRGIVVKDYNEVSLILCTMHLWLSAKYTISHYLLLIDISTIIVVTEYRDAHQDSTGRCMFLFSIMP